MGLEYTEVGHQEHISEGLEKGAATCYNIDCTLPKVARPIGWIGAEMQPTLHSPDWGLMSLHAFRRALSFNVHKDTLRACRVLQVDLVSDFTKRAPLLERNKMQIRKR